MEIFVNGWKSTLGSAGITSTATAIPVQVADAAKLPTLAVGDFIRAVLPVYDVNGQQVDEEIVFITAIDPATGTLTVTRAQEGTTARGFAGSAPIFTGPTAGAMGALRDVAAGAAQKLQNLADLADAPTARANLGLGSAATHAAADFSLAVQNNDVATTDPTVTDDSAAGYAIGSRWINKTGTGEIWRCIDATAGAAKWVKTTLTLDELGSAATHAATDFAPAAGNAAQGFEGAAATAATYFVNLGQLQNGSLVISAQSLNSKTGANFCTDGPGAGVEVGPVNGQQGLTYFDFHTGATPVDYDARLICSLPNGVAGAGASADLFFDCRKVQVPVGTAGVEALQYQQSSTANTRQDMTALRALGTVYTNTQGRPIRVNISGQASAANGAVAYQIGSNPAVAIQSSTAGNSMLLSFEVLPNETYTVTASNFTFSKWEENR